ncbi:hypothetical protein A2V80_00035 [Candidatus Woesebacteria bacterium RBG_16_39_8b]|uniref:Uncharacterized protein n=1 Tax=Candidatus Woesebacteria bacterium RBG_16_39_8b TaxID=1802482 RepID=A0A1F7XDV3_9BACT|nr:MAG: hypothetical protein A2V80_00035 [Candidatus Woesebacteria bacterium RBG_16_39_8b]
MIKKFFLLFGLILIIGLGVFAGNAYTQGPTEYDRLYQEYSLKVEEYRRSRDEYILARSQYLKFKTLTSQNTAKEKTIIFLQARDEVVVSYIKTVIEKLKETQGIPDATRDAVITRLNDEATWFSDHKGRVSAAGSLEDLVSDSDEAKKRYELIDPLLYEALSVLSSGRVNRYRERLDDTFASVKSKVTEIREEDREEYKFETRKLEIIDRWIFDTEGRIIRSQEKLVEADGLIAGFTSAKIRGASNYNEVLEVLGESQQYLKEASLFVKEIIREIKTED